MALFVLTCIDKPESLALRLATREAHFAYANGKPGMINAQVQNLGNNRSFTGGTIHNYAVDRMWGAALTLIIIVMGLNLIARLLGRFNKVSG